MTNSDVLLKGTIHGKTIELEHEAGLPDGQQVTLLLLPVLAAGAGIRQSAGAWADAGEDLDTWLEEVQRGRQQPRPEVQ